MKRFFSFFLFFFSLNCIGQNLVPNPSFEQYTLCPDNWDELSYCQGWIAFRETPEYYNTCSTFPEVTPPNCSVGFQYPHSGNSFVGMYTFNSTPNNREFIGNQLLSPFVLGQRYFISFYVNLSGSVYWGITIGANKMGVKFSTVPYSYTNPAPINNTAHFYSDVTVTDTVKWTKISGSFIADSAYSYIMIGNFFDDSHTDTVNLALNNNVLAYYYIDDVCVSTDSLYCENWVGVKEQSVKKEEITIYPNPCTNQLNVQINKELYSHAFLSVVNITGKTIMQTTTTENEYVFNTEKLAKGLYLVKVEIGQKVCLTKFTKD